MKTINLFIIALFFPLQINAVDPLTFSAARNCSAYNAAEKNWVELKQGDMVESRNSVMFGRLTGISASSHIVMSITKEDKELAVYAKDLKPGAAANSFASDIFIDYPEDIINNEPPFETKLIGFVQEMWVPGYYSKILENRNREDLLYYEPYILESVDILPDYENWYDVPFNNIQNGRSMFYNAVIQIGFDNFFIVKDITKEEYGYTVTCIEAAQNGRNYAQGFNWSLIEKNTLFDLILIIDGDFLDIFVNNTDNYFGTLVKVKREFIAQYQNLIGYNDCDLGNIVWPQRSSKQFKPGEICIALENIKIREGPETAGIIINILERSSELTVLEVGNTESIGDITSPWVKVRTNTGTIGWCHGIYLMKVRVESILQDNNNASLGGKSSPLTLLLARSVQGTQKTFWDTYLYMIFISAGSLLAAGIILFLVIQKIKDSL
jgi:hypothetical protein